MRIRNLFLSLLVFFIIEGSTPLEVVGVVHVNSIEAVYDDFINHTVVSGETVYSIARAYKTTVDEIYRLNPEARNGIKGGQVLKLPKAKAQDGKGNPDYFEHVVQKGETLYRISKINEVSIETLYNLNPELKKEGLKEGMILKVPRLKITPSGSNAPDLRPMQQGGGESSLYIDHHVFSGETLYGLSKRYDVAIEDIFKANPELKDGLKTGMSLRIPKNNQSPSVLTPGTKLYGAVLNQGETVRVGVLLPFTEGGGGIQKEKLVEYYEGFLLALRELKAVGLNAEVFTFDTGKEGDTKRLENILETNEIQNLHLLIGGVSPKQISILSDFSRRTGTRYVIPFGVGKDKDVVSASPNIFQMTVSHKTLFPEITKAFVDKFRKDNIVFITESGSDTNKKDFVDVLKAVLAAESVPYKEVQAKDNIVEDIKAVLSSDKNNILIPTSSSEITLRRTLGVLAPMVDRLGSKAKDAESSPQITLFGYPDWQVYLNYTAQLYKYNTYIYSGFYLDESDKHVQQEMYNYKKWYNKEIPFYFPKFCFLGYDTGIYFLSGLQKYRNSFGERLSSFSAPTLQSAIHFEKVNENSGYINSGFYFVHYVTDSSVEKIEIK